MKIFQPEQVSLFGELLDWMLTPLLLLLPASLTLTWLVAQDIAGQQFDRTLEFNARALSQLVMVQGDRTRFNLPQPARQLLLADDSDTIYFQVLGLRGELLGGERDFPGPPEDELRRSDQVYLRDDEMRNQEVRVAHLWLRLSAEPEARWALVQVAETREKRAALATQIIKGVLLPQSVLLPLAVFLVWLALARALRPVAQLRRRVHARRAEDLSPLDEKSVPLELAPLIVSVNELLGRLQESLASQKRFLANAAHQLKTPLAGLRMQADLALRAGGSADELKRSLEQMEQASVRATHTVNQLLALARAETRSDTLPQQACDLATLAQQALNDALPRALARHVDLGYEGDAPGAAGVGVLGNPTLLQELISNLLDNALNYTPSSAAQPGVVTLRVLADRFGGVVLLQVEDSGPGIPEAERERVFQPFYRLLGSGAEGSGLGLSIVQEIARRHGAQIELGPTRPGKTPTGTCVSVRFVSAEG